MTTRLCRSRDDAILGGVCGGLAQHFGIDPTLTRLLAVMLIRADAGGMLLYLLLWIALPPEGAESTAVRGTARQGADEIVDRALALGGELRTALNSASPRAALLVGAALILMGVTFLLEQVSPALLRWLDFGHLWPALVIAGGLALVWRRAREAAEGA